MLQIYLFSYLHDELDLFRDREDPTLVYVVIRNKLQDNLLKDFHLSNAISLAGRLYRALPDKYINAKHYVDEIKRVLTSKIGDYHFTRRMGLNVTSMLLGLSHQRKFDGLMARYEDNPIMKEPFDREVKGKMANVQRQHLDGPEKYGSLGALSKKSTEMVAMMATNKLPLPTRANDSKFRRKSRNDKKGRKYDGAGRKRDSFDRKGRSKFRKRFKRKQIRVESEEENPNEVEVKKSRPEKRKPKSSKVSKADLQRIIGIAAVSLFQ